MEEKADLKHENARLKTAADEVNAEYTTFRVCYVYRNKHHFFCRFFPYS